MPPRRSSKSTSRPEEAGPKTKSHWRRKNHAFVPTSRRHIGGVAGDGARLCRDRIGADKVQTGHGRRRQSLLRVNESTGRRCPCPGRENGLGLRRAFNNNDPATALKNAQIFVQEGVNAVIQF